MMDYYNRKYIIYEILKNVKDRDFSLLNNYGANIRALNVKLVYDFQNSLKLVRWDLNKPNLYRSVATLKNIPRFTFSPKNRSSETREWFEKEYRKHIVKYDLFFDFDKKPEDSWDKILEEIKEFKTYLDSWEVPYYVVFSGSKGFQFIIDGKYLDIENIEGGNVYPHKTISEKIKEKFNFRFLDLANNGVMSRLCKVPYSLVLPRKDIKREYLKDYPEQEMNVALPLSDEQIENFNIIEMKAKYILSNIKLIRRGNLERFENIGFNEKKENVKKFVNIFK